ncbi:MAG: hypothetical protein UHN47_03900 [Lachnospiraceae bacterium]|nr:hypothetical protein [Lachnospiraceae bacterium]
MIIAVRDSDNNYRQGAAMTALLAGITAIGKSKKTIAIQLTGFTQDSIMDILYGKAIKNNTIRDIYSFTDDGLDGLLLRAETADLTKEHYDECVTPLLQKENMFDVIKPTSKPNIMDIIECDVLENVVKNAESVYDYVYLFLPNDDEKLYEEVTKYTDKELVMVPQGITKQVDFSNGKTHIVVKDFEESSKFDMSYIRKQYNVKTLYTLPYNVGYRDAVISENLLDFILVNRNDIKNDDNYSFSSSLWHMISKFVAKDDEDNDDETEKFTNKEEKGYLAVEEKTELPETAIQQVKVKKGLFRKKDEYIVNM